jgi:NAD(P)-dependent dehydrogenase (short-subunit alcohol dehydrogenase family)
MRVVLITGAANGIGLALTKVYLEHHAKVIMVDYDAKKLQEESSALSRQFPDQITAHTCDVTNIDQVKTLSEAIFNQIDHIDILYNNAGIIGALAPIWELSNEQVQQVLAVNLYGMVHMIQSFIPKLIKQNAPSHVVNMASMYALCSGSQNAPYAMSKHAVLALSESLYYDLSRLEKPIDVSVVFPSFTDTGLLSKPTDINMGFHESLKSLLSHSRPADDVASHVVKAVEQKQFYIFPDKEVKSYAEERTRSLVLQELPHVNNVERVVRSLIKRNTNPT